MQLVGIMWIKVAPMVVVATATIFQLKHAISVYEFWRGLSFFQWRKKKKQWQRNCWWQKGPITSEIHIRHILWSFCVAASTEFSLFFLYCTTHGTHCTKSSFLTARELAREVLVIAFSKVGQSRLSRGKSPSVGQSRVGYHCVILRKFSKV